VSVVANPIKVLIADDQTLFRTGLARMLGADPRFEVVGQARDGADAVYQTLARRPDIVLMDLQMPNVSGVEATKRLTSEAPNAQVIVLSAYADKAMMNEALASGAKDFVDKDITLDEMVATILTVGAGGKPAPRRADLSHRELHVLAHVADGMSNKQIARRLGISEKTVRNHLSRVFNKLTATNRTEAVMHAMRIGLLII
jgi:DNA-binding NarL/FixJ family response regulator